MRRLIVLVFWISIGAGCHQEIGSDCVEKPFPKIMGVTLFINLYAVVMAKRMAIPVRLKVTALQDTYQANAVNNRHV